MERLEIHFLPGGNPAEDDRVPACTGNPPASQDVFF